MATNRTSRNRASSKRKAMPQKQAVMRQAPAAAELHKVIEQLIDAKQRGDGAVRDKAAAALAAFHKRAAAAEVRQAAAEAKAVAGNPVMVDSLRLLGDIAARLKPTA